MNASTVRRADKRFESFVNQNLGILFYGKNNLYPQEMRNLVDNSDSASSCMEKYIEFIEGNGFRSEQISELVLNDDGDTADDLLVLLADDIGHNKGIALQVNYNALGQITEINHIPFENCRLCEPDEDGKIKKIAVHPDWTGKTKRNGKILSVNRDNIDYIDIFNPDKNVVYRQIEEAGGIEFYKGQILWVSFKGKFVYPKPKQDPVIAQMSTEEGLGNIANRNVLNGFRPSGMLMYRKGQNFPIATEEGVEQNKPEDNYTIEDAIIDLQTDENTCNIGTIGYDYDEEKPEFINLQGNNYDKDFNVTTETCEAKIYAVFNQEVFYRIRSGSLGFSAEIMSQAYEYYNTVTSKERRMIERAFTKILSHWHTVVPTNDFSIEPLKYISSEPNNTI